MFAAETMNRGGRPRRSLGISLIASYLLAACGPELPTEVPPTADDTLVQGRALALSCVPCHTFGAGEAHGIGPNLHGFLGQPAARRTDFAYSRALVDSGIVWSPAAVDAWLQNPSALVPGTSMVFAGYRGEGERQALLAYLGWVTAADAPE